MVNKWVGEKVEGWLDSDVCTELVWGFDEEDNVELVSCVVDWGVVKGWVDTEVGEKVCVVEIVIGDGVESGDTGKFEVWIFVEVVGFCEGDIETEGAF